MLLKFLLRCLHLLADLVCGLYGIVNAGRHVRWFRGSRRDWPISRSWSEMSRLPKLPQHIGWIILEDPISYRDISNIVVWCMALGITYISVYDHDGVIKKNKETFHNHIMMTKNKLFGSESKLYKVRLDSVNLNGVVNGYSNAKNVFVNIFSHTDGRRSIAKAAREVCTSVAQGLLKPSDIDCHLLENYVTLCHNAPDPELLVLTGPTYSTLGFLPWHIRLSEILSLSSHYDVCFEDFYNVLARYSKCEQRFGK